MTNDEELGRMIATCFFLSPTTLLFLTHARLRLSLVSSCLSPSLTHTRVEQEAFLDIVRDQSKKYLFFPVQSREHFNGTDFSTAGTFDLLLCC